LLGVAEIGERDVVELKVAAAGVVEGVNGLVVGLADIG
jgi:hypothetical protein